jgi:hypothetical protein
MALKYASQLQDIEGCPPSSHYPADGKGYRFVHNPPAHPKDFLPPLRRSPTRALKGSKARCSGWALSFFKSLDAAESRYVALRESIPNIATSLGDAIAEVFLEASDGVMTAPDHRGHFDLHESAGATFEDRVTVVKIF